MSSAETETAASRWALVLGASSGFGRAAALALARAGHHIAGVHLDGRAARAEIDQLVAEIEGSGRQALLFNVNAAKEAHRQRVLEALAERAGSGGVRLLLHSLAFGSLRPLVAPLGGDERLIDQRALEMTVDVMAHSLLYWTQDLVARELLAPGGRVVALTSAGSTVVWPGYGAVSAAKAALEAQCRQLAVELAPRRITVNALMPGVTETPALRKIPAHAQLLAQARTRNPHGRLTRPEDVARAITLLLSPDADWITGNTIRVDGGEGIVG